MRDLYLKFDNREDCRAALQLVGAWDSAMMAIDDIGTLFKPVDEQYVKLKGYHANLRVMDETDLSSLEKYRVYPVTPLRVWG